LGGSSGRGLVQEERPRVTEQGARDRHPLLLAAGERGGVAIEQLGLESHLGERVGQARLREIAGRARGPKAEIVAHRPVEEDRRLHDERGAAPELAGIQEPDVATLEPDRPRGRLLEAIKASQQARLPRPRRAHERERLTALHGEGDVVQNLGRGLPATSWIGE
jgi:hypothetical protein